MGTNYYLHLGKRSALAPGRCSFTIAAGLVALLAQVPGDARVVEDEHGNRLTVDEFKARIIDDDPIADQMWTEFS